MKVIAFRKVKEPYGWLGNMSPSPITYEGKIYRTAEALFQALRFESDEYREKIRSCTSPMTAKMSAKKHEQHMAIVPRSREDLANMKKVLELKLQQHPQLVSALLATGDAQIVEDCSSRPQGSGTFWGAVKAPEGWVGENQLGKLWMELREALRTSS